MIEVGTLAVDESAVAVRRGLGKLNYNTFNSKHKSYNAGLHLHCLKKLHFCFCQNFIKFPPTLISFGR